MIYCNEHNYKKILVSGGATVNDVFMEKNIVNKIVLNYNPYVLSKGVPLFSGNYFKSKLKLGEIVKESEDIMQIHYNVINDIK